MASSVSNRASRGQAAVSDFGTRQSKVAPLSVLVADDTPAFQKLVQQILQERGHRVTSIGDGGQASRLVESHPFDVIIVDVQMPVMDGLALTSWIREREKTLGIHTPVILLTAHSESSMQSAGASAGVDGYLSKPVDAQRLIALVEELGSPQQGSTMNTSRAKGNPALTNKSNDTESAPIVDFNGAMMRLGGDRELFREFIGVYDEDMPSLLEALHRALNGHDANSLERNAHSLRGLISNFGARRAVDVASQIEEIAKNNRWPDASEALSKLEQEIKMLSDALDDYRK